MTILSDVQIAEVARGQGAGINPFSQWTGWRDDRPSSDANQRHSELAVAIAVCLAESGGNTAALGPVLPDGRRAHGLWQILANPIDEGLLDPETNGKQAHAIYVSNGNRFSGRWSAFDSGAYRVFLPRAEAAVRQTHRDRPGVTRPSAYPGFEAVKDIGSAIVFVVKFLATGGLIRIGEAFAGAALVLVGIAIVVLNTKPGAEVADKVRAGITKGVA